MPEVGLRVYITGTKHHGFKGHVVPTPDGWPYRAVCVHLDEWPNEVFKFYCHNLCTYLPCGRVVPYGDTVK